VFIVTQLTPHTLCCSNLAFSSFFRTRFIQAAVLSVLALKNGTPGSIGPPLFRIAWHEERCGIYILELQLLWYPRYARIRPVRPSSTKLTPGVTRERRRWSLIIAGHREPARNCPSFRFFAESQPQENFRSIDAPWLCVKPLRFGNPTCALFPSNASLQRLLSDTRFTTYLRGRSCRPYRLRRHICHPTQDSSSTARAVERAGRGGCWVSWSPS
jgi:hypothetical protein